MSVIKFSEDGSLAVWPLLTVSTQRAMFGAKEFLGKNVMEKEKAICVSVKK